MNEQHPLLPNLELKQEDDQTTGITANNIRTREKIIALTLMATVFIGIFIFVCAFKFLQCAHALLVDCLGQQAILHTNIVVFWIMLIIGFIFGILPYIGGAIYLLAHLI
jgi:cytochrome c oxidase subunit IV